MNIKLPNWPPERLVRESIWAWNLRHPGKELSATSPWPDLCAAIHRFLRHQCSAYDQTLDACEGYDEEVRDELAERIYQAARRQFLWLRQEHDPRPFAKAERPELLFDQRSWALSHIHTRISHLESAIKDLQRLPGNRAHLVELREELSEYRELAGDEFKSLTRTPAKGYARSLTWVRNKKRGYYYGGHALKENHTAYAGFRCEVCGMAVMRSKRPVPIGQGRRWLAWSCLCLSYCLEPAPGGYRIEPVTAQLWAQLRLNADEQQNEPKEDTAI